MLSNCLNPNITNKIMKDWPQYPEMLSNSPATTNSQRLYIFKHSDGTLDWFQYKGRAEQNTKKDKTKGNRFTDL